MASLDAWNRVSAQAEVRDRFQRRELPQVDHSARLAELAHEIKNVTDAIASGLLSDALAARLKAAEAEQARLQAASRALAQSAPRSNREPVARRAQRMLAKIAAGGDTARGVLQELFPHAIKLRADASGQYFWAEFDDQGLIDLLYDSPAERHAVTRALFDPAIPGGVISDATLFAALNSARRLEVGNSMVAGARFVNYRRRLSLAGKGRGHRGRNH
jgi:DNA-binding transcriptional MocR family regulator